VADTTARVLKLLSLLQAHRGWTGAELAERLEVSDRTLRRDIERLRELGYPVVATTGPAGGYQLVAGKNMPPLLLDDEEALAIAVGLLTAAGGTVGGIEEASVSALAKLEQVLPPRVRERVNAVQETVTPVIRPWVTVDATTLSVVAQSCRDHERIRFDYRDRYGEMTDRNVEPHQLVVVSQRWYLVGYDRERDDWRTFRIDRMGAPFRTKQSFEPRRIPGGDASTYVLESRAAMPGRYEAVLIVEAPADDVSHRVWAGSGRVESISAGRCRLVLHGDSIEWIAQTILWLDVDFKVDGPPELLEHLASLTERIRKAL